MCVDAEFITASKFYLIAYTFLCGRLFFAYKTYLEAVFFCIWGTTMAIGKIELKDETCNRLENFWCLYYASIRLGSCTFLFLTRTKCYKRLIHFRTEKQNCTKKPNLWHLSYKITCTAWKPFFSFTDFSLIYNENHESQNGAIMVKVCALCSCNSTDLGRVSCSKLYKSGDCSGHSTSTAMSCRPSLRINPKVLNVG